MRTELQHSALETSSNIFLSASTPYSAQRPIAEHTMPLLRGCIPMPKKSSPSGDVRPTSTSNSHRTDRNKLRKRWGGLRSGSEAKCSIRVAVAERSSSTTGRSTCTASKSLCCTENVWRVCSVESGLIVCRFHKTTVENVSAASVMGPMDIMQESRDHQLMRKPSKASASGSECSAASGRHASTSRSCSTSSSECFGSVEEANNACRRGAGSPLEELLKSYTLHVRLLMYARDLQTSMKSSRDVRTSFHADPVLLPAEYFNQSDRYSILSTKVSGTRCYQDVVEEVLLDKRGHFSSTDILPLVQRTFSLRTEDIMSMELCQLQESFHKQHRIAMRQTKAAQRMSVFGEHSV